MRKRVLVFSTFFLVFSFIPTLGHEDFWLTREYGNIKVRVKSGFDYEEINKAFIIGQLAQSLVKDLGYTKQIFIDFNHHYTNDCEPDYFISFDDGKIKYQWEDNNQEKLFDGNAVVIRQVARSFDVVATLKLVEYSVLNIKKVKSLQKEIEYNQNFCDWTINSIDTLLIDKLVTLSTSPLVEKTCSMKIERPDEDFRYGLSYYWQNGKYYVFLRRNGQEDEVVLELPTIYNIQKIDSEINLIFDSDSSFYCITTANQIVVSKQHEIVDTFEYYRPYYVTRVSNNKLSIYFEWFKTGFRELEYLISEDELEQGLRK